MDPATCLNTNDASVEFGDFNFSVYDGNTGNKEGIYGPPDTSFVDEVAMRYNIIIYTFSMYQEHRRRNLKAGGWRTKNFPT
ncbi:hypothetical protein RR48_06208 [Papilio machaon]|uniref:Uncharacterized protein n=1 Tax=Papilio machaon TaxID=76193 RepID=A0A194QUR4_PAPMA|nr:hypothetical protein RR48_06208 [Papilio machaon]